MARQMSFDLPSIEGLGRADFYVAPSNATALAMIESATWHTPQLVLSGPEGSGKTHLVQIWSELAGAEIVAARDLPDAAIPALASGPVAVEDVPAIASDTVALKGLFHLYNLATQRGHRLVLTGRGSPRHWGLQLPDIQSRIDAAHHVAVEAPDDKLLAAVLGKLFADRQITPKPEVIPYLVARMERSFKAAGKIVGKLDKLSLDEGRTLSRKLAARLVTEGQSKE